MTTKNETTIGRCEHGEFDLMEGCPECIKAQMKAFVAHEGAKTDAGVQPEQEEPEPASSYQPMEITLVEPRIPALQRALVRIEPLKDAEVEALVVEALKILEYADALTITDLEQSKKAVNDLSLISGIKKRMEAKKKEYLGPVKEIQDTLRQQFTDIMTPVLEAEKITKEKQMGFLQEQARIQAEQEEINRKRREAAEAEMRLKGELTEPVNEVEVIEAPARVSTDLGTTGLTDHWIYEVVDIMEVPREYLVIDGAMLTAIARKHHDQKQIQGIKFINKPYLAIRTR